MSVFNLTNFEDAKSLAFMLLLVQARLMPMFVIVPFMSRSMVPRTIAFGFASVGMAVTSFLTNFQQMNWVNFFLLPM